MKVAIIILSDPANESQESLGRVFNGLAAAYDFKQAEDEVRILFHGTATRWPAVLLNEDHPAHGLYQAVADKVEGVSCGCADVFGSRDDATKSGLELVKDNKVPGTTGLPSFRKLLEEKYTVLTF